MSERAFDWGRKDQNRNQIWSAHINYKKGIIKWGFTKYYSPELGYGSGYLVEKIQDYIDNDKSQFPNVNELLSEYQREELNKYLNNVN